MQSILIRPQAAVIQPCGALSADSAIKVQHQLNTAILSDQNSRVWIDMEQVESIDSAGLMALVSSLKLAKRVSKPVSLCSVSHSIRMVFELSQLDTVCEIYADQSTLEQLTA